ncbi:MAG: EAL domain-containing protein [Sulfurovum sp.]|nr:EAL domain-containing protein [Sulfurovaceae bacterium]
MDLIILGGVIAISIIIFIVINKSYTKHIKKCNGEASLYRNGQEYQNDAMLIFSNDGEVIFANKSARKMFDLDVHYQNKHPEKQILVKMADSDITQPIMDCIINQRNKGMNFLENTLISIGETNHRINLYVDNSKWNIDNNIICVFQDANSNFKEKEAIKQLTETDILTGLPSQFKALLDINDIAVESQKRSERFAVAILDIANYDKIRTTKGHTYTNSILKKFAQFLEEQKHSDMEIYRLDDSNFLILVINFKREKQLLESIEDITNEVTSRFDMENRNVAIISSVGLVMFPDHGKNANKLIDRAYIALEEANKKGYGSIVLYTNRNKEAKRDEMQISQEIRIGLKEKEFVIYYEPIYNLETNIISGAQVMLKWQHPRFGLIDINKFIDIAENTGQIINLNKFIISEVIHQRKLWNDFHFRNIELVITLSHTQLHSDKFIPNLKSLFNRNNVDSDDFTFDVSNSIATQGMLGCHREFLQLKKLDIGLAIDNLSVGLSTADQLHNKIIKTLKVDNALLEDASSQAVLKSIISLAHSLDIEVRAENITTNNEAEIISEFECDKAHGKHFSKPLLAFELQEFLR